MVSTRGVRYKFSEGERVLCYEPDPTKAKVLYDSKVLEVIENKDRRGRRTIEYLIHFQGWNSSWDRCVGEDFVLKDTEENRQLQRDLAEKSQLQLGAYLYRRERKKGSTSGSGGSSAAKRSRHRFSDEGSSSSTQPDEHESEEPGHGEPEAADEENSQESPEEEIKEEIETDSSESSEDEPTARAGAHLLADHVQPVGRANLTIPAVLRDRLTFDYHLIVKRNRLTRLPASPCAAQILESFVKWFARAGAWNTPRCRNEPPQKPDLADVSRRLNLVREVADGMRVYFDFIMRGNLLYKPELVQYHQVCGQFIDQQERKMKEELESDGMSQDEYEDDIASAEEDIKSPKIPEYSHLPPDPIQAPDENGIVNMNHIKQEIKEEPEDNEEENQMTEEMDAELQERMQEAMQQEMEAGMAQEMQEEMAQEMEEGMEQEMQEGMEQDMQEGMEEEMPEEEDMQIKEEIEDQEYYQEDYQEESQEDIQDDLQDDFQDQLEDDIQDDLEDYQVEIQEELHDEYQEDFQGEIEEVLQVVIHQEIEVEIQLVIREELHEEIIDEKQIEEYDNIPNEKVKFVQEEMQETKEIVDEKVKEAVVMEIKQEKEDATGEPNLQPTQIESPKPTTEQQPSDSQSPDDPIVQAKEDPPSHKTIDQDPQTSDSHHSREGLRSRTAEAHREGLRSHTSESHRTREGLRSRSLEGHSIREGLRSQSMEGHHSPRSPVVEDSFANTVRRELHRPYTRSRRGNNSPAVDRGTNSPATEDFPGSVADDPQSFANTVRQQINRPATRGQRRRGNNSPATPPVTEEPQSSNTASSMEAPLITEIKQEPDIETNRPATRTRSRSCKSVSSPAVNSPAVNLPAVNSPAVNIPAVDSLTDNSPVVDSPTVNSPVVDSPAVNSPAVNSPAVDSPAVTSPEEAPGGSNATVEGHGLITEFKQEPRDPEISRPATRSGNVARRLRSRKSAVSQSENEEPQPSTSKAEPLNFEHSSSVGSGSGSSNEEWPKPAEPASTASSTRTPLSLLLDKVSKYEIIPREGTEHLPCRVYGAIHLARLFVRLPDFLNATQMSDFKLKLVVKHIEMFIQYLVEHKEWFGEKFYYCDSMSRST